MFGKSKVKTPARPIEWTRTCNKCGTERYIPKAWATEVAPNDRRMKWQERSAKMASSERYRGAEAQQLLAVTQKRDRVLQNAICPQCGSMDYTQNDENGNIVS